MEERTLYRYWIPAPKWKPRAKPYLSEHMDETTAKARGALKRDDGSRMVVRDVHGGGMGLGIARAGGGAPR